MGSLTEVCSAGQDNPTPNIHPPSPAPQAVSLPAALGMWELEGTPKLSHGGQSQEEDRVSCKHLLVWEHPLSKHTMRGKKTFQTQSC